MDLLYGQTFLTSEIVFQENSFVWDRFVLVFCSEVCGEARRVVFCVRGPVDGAGHCGKVSAKALFLDADWLIIT